MENQGSVNLKPNKPEPYDGRRDCLVVNTWLYKVEHYLILAGIANPAVPLNDAKQILFASTFLTGTAAVWWYTLVQSGRNPTTWIEFKAAMVEEFAPEDHVRRARDKLRKLKQTFSVSKYLSELRNMVLTIPDITEGDKFDKFCSGLRYEVRLEVMKSTGNTFNESARIALRVDSALWSAGNYTGFSAGSGSASNTPTPMEIGNIEKSGSRGMDPQRLKDIRTNSCFLCHTPGCRPWKHVSDTGFPFVHKGKARIANMEIDEIPDNDRQVGDIEDSEN